MKDIRIFVLTLFALFLGCAQEPGDEDNAVVTGRIYKYAEYETPSDSVWIFYEPVESVTVYVESDIDSDIPYEGPDIIGFTDSRGIFSIPVYLGNTADATKPSGYKPVYYADVRVLVVYNGKGYDFGGGITLGRGDTFYLGSISLEWFTQMGGGK